jgi:CRISPR-associated endonuclease Cas1
VYDNRRVIALGANAAMRVRRGALELEHGRQGERVAFRFDVDDPPPRAILFDGRGEFISGEALRWSARRGVSVILSDGPGRCATFIDTALEAEEGAATLPDIDPAIIRAQCRADPLTIARELVREKIDAEARHMSERQCGDIFEAWRWQAEAMRAPSLPQLLIIEAKASAVYWRAFASLGLRQGKGEPLPRSWLRFANRNRGAKFLGNQHARHPINAMLNYCYVVEAGRLARALHARGMALSIGFLHADKKGRNSLVWDAIEPLRPAISERVFAFIERREFSRADFPPAGVETRRIAQPVIAELLSRCLLSDRTVADAADYMVRLVCAPPKRKREQREAIFHDRP